MTIIVDTAPLVCLADNADPRREAVRKLLKTTRSRLIIPAQVTAEVDYFLATRFRPIAARNFVGDLAAGRFEVQCLEASDYAEVARLSLRYDGMNPGLADLSLVVLAARFKTTTLLTFDERHFRHIEPLQGGRFTLLPADA